MMEMFYDADTQNDFMDKDGALYVPDAELIKPNLKLLTDFARKNKIPILGSVYIPIGTPEDRKRELTKWGGPFPYYSTAYSRGQLKIRETSLEETAYKMQAPIFNVIHIPNMLTRNITKKEILADDRILNELVSIDDPLASRKSHVRKVLQENFKRKIYCGDPRAERLMQDYIEGKKTGLDSHLLNTAVDIIQKIQFKIPTLANKRTPHARKVPRFTGIYFEKQQPDVFTNPMLKEALGMIEMNQAVVYGVTTDYCIKAAVLEMQDRKIQCYVVEDAIKGVNPKTTKQALEEMIQAGAKLITTKDILGGKYEL